MGRASAVTGKAIIAPAATAFDQPKSCSSARKNKLDTGV